MIKKTNEENRDRTKKNHQYDKMDQSFSGHLMKHEKNMHFNEIKLDLESTLIEVSDYFKDGGGGGDEWPYKVLNNSRH